MKKFFLSLMLSLFALSIYSCRETTQEKTEDALEAIGEDVEDGTRRAADKLEEGAENIEKEVHEEMHETDDHMEH
ncbi:hypothetical protein [Salinimicrobium xinjiangense]|uniref:hypothetical protein n=1 Tax=Salinimicrobium xinjiangense TaxID=438596 RepID=UPI0004163627|nr:hypothetical protein [Salinimicrobium xinjiangense]